MSRNEQEAERVDEIRSAVHHANQPILFYGQVVDQNDAPVPGVAVRLTVKHTEEPLPGSAQDVLDLVDETTDINGQFRLSGKEGSLLTVQSLTKDGYEAPYTGSRAFWYEEIVKGQKYYPNKDQPEIFRLWKSAGAERLVRNSISRGIPCDGTEIGFDLIKGRVVDQGGDLRVKLIRTPLKIQWEQSNYAWTAMIEAPGGGVVEAVGDFKYEAPVSGYQPVFTVHMDANDPKWTDRKDVSLYVKLRDNRYGRADLRFAVGSDRESTPLGIISYINESGSRNLEYDPLQELDTK